jgi:2-polyprenyl-3-methyl-5-hydroxy-6-metoxy-1,4-benzoquinol methylase
VKSFEEYSAHYYDDSHKNWNLHPHYAYFELLSRRILSSGNLKKVIDVGCGKGEFLRYLRSRGAEFELVGVDMSANNPEERITYLQGDFLTVDVKTNFDVVVSLAAIEHVGDIQKFVQRLGHLCHPSGLIMVMTLDDRSIMYEIARLMFYMGVRSPFQRLYSRHHLHHFNSSSLVRLMEENGLNVVEHIHHNIPLAAVDMPKVSFLKRFVFLAGVAVSFALGKLLGRTYLQTLICRKKSAG